MQNLIKSYLSEIGRIGGRKSRRTLTSDSARLMTKIREARRAFKRFRSSCFWSYNPDMKITADDISWIAHQLKKNGNREAWIVAERLCR